MPNNKYLIIGGGMTSDAAVAGIRKADPAGSIGLISAESHPPYNRPPLSKGLWKGKPLESIYRQTSTANTEIHLGRMVDSIDTGSKQVKDDQGQRHGYQKLLLATGANPRQLPFGKDEIIYFRTLDDFQRLQKLSEKSGRFAVIGGGFIGSELASALTDHKQDVVMIFPERGIGALIFPPDLASFLNDFYRQKGVDVLAEELVSDVERRGDELVLKLKSGREVIVDHVVAGIGI